MKIVGIDLSLASTGVAVITQHGATVDRIQTKPVGDSLRARHRRLHGITMAVRDRCQAADLVVIEGLAYASRSPHATERAGLWWMTVSWLYGSLLDLAVASPAARAKYATGKGNAAKDAVLAAVVRRYPDVEVTGNDSADALVLAAMGARALGSPIDDLPAAHLAAMDKVEWPEVVPC